MIRRFLLALALSCGLVPAANASLGVIRLNYDAESNRDCDAYQRALENCGVQFTLIPESVCLRTMEQIDSLAVGKVNLYGSTWVRFDALAVPGYRYSMNVSLDSLASRHDRPRHVPLLLLSYRGNSNSMTYQANQCSTGVGNGITSITNAIHAYDPRSWRTFVMGTTIQSFTTYYVKAAALNESSYGMWRPLIGACGTGGVGTANVVAADSLAASPSRVFVWARMFTTSTGGPLLTPRVRRTDTAVDTARAVIWASYNQSSQQGIYSIAMAATAFLDSLARGRVLAGAGRNLAVYCEGISNWNTTTIGITPTDSSFVAGMFRDSLARLGIPIGAAVNPCSLGVASKAYLQPWLSPSAFYLIPQSYGDYGGGTAGPNNPTDMTGYLMNRQAYDGNVTCTGAGDTSITCLLINGARLVAVAYPTKFVSRTIVGVVGGNWLPRAGAETDLATIYGGRMGGDSLLSAFAKADYRTIISNGRSDPWWSTSLFAVNGTRLSVRPPGQLNSNAGLGAATMVGDTLPAYGREMRVWNYQTGASTTMDWEVFASSCRSDGAADPKVQYQCRAGESVYRIIAGDLVNGAGVTAMNTAATVAPGYYETKWFVNAAAIMNAYAWTGNNVLRFVRVDQL